jgi:outer membrane protein OmpA-like peptidoglycan-associated protein
MRLLPVLIFVFSNLSFGQTDTVRIFFDNNSSEIQDSVANAIRSLQKPVLKLNAYCDRNGSVVYNDALAAKRANAVRSLLSEQIIDSMLTQLIGEKGQEELTSYAHEYWRRVDLILEDPPPVEELLPSEMIQEQVLTEQLVAFVLDSTVSEQVIELSIQFYPGLPIVLPEFEGQLFVLFDFLRIHEDVSAEIHGHVCCADDYPLSYQRAHMVYQFLMDRTISPKRLKYKGFSNSKPKISPELTDYDRQQNRRVEVVVRKITL